MLSSRGMTAKVEIIIPHADPSNKKFPPLIHQQHQPSSQPRPPGLVSKAMTSATDKALRLFGAWRNRFPSMTTDYIQVNFFGPARGTAREVYTPGGTSVRRTDPKLSTAPFIAKIQPIGRLTAPIAPYADGTNILRAFLYARGRWPQLGFRNVSSKSMQAVYETNRIDGLPRVVFVVSKGVENLLKGKLHGVLRRRYKKRGRWAFIAALHELKKEDLSHLNCMP
jgi:hypothetical protein